MLKFLWTDGQTDRRTDVIWMTLPFGPIGAEGKNNRTVFYNTLNIFISTVLNEVCQNVMSQTIDPPPPVTLCHKFYTHLPPTSPHPR